MKFIGDSPVDFKNNPNPILIFENASNGNLEKMNKIKKKISNSFNDTKKLIILFGISSAMSYLHSKNIIHCSLKPLNIYLDDFLFPKITGFENSKLLSENPIQSLSEIINDDSFDYDNDNDIYNPPEVIKSHAFSSDADVFSFAVIAYQLIANENPFIDNFSYDGYRPDFKETIPDCYKKLINKCWSHDPKERPTFDEITNHLKTNSEFISEKVDKIEYENYIQFIEDFYENKKEVFDDFVKTQNQRFRKIKINYNNLRDWSRLHLTVNLGSSDLSRYEKQSKIGHGSFGNVYKVIDKQKDVLYAAKVSIYETDQCPEIMIIDLSREIDIISQLYHPSILRFIGFSPKNFKNKNKPVIITEFASNGSLEDILKMERKGLGNHDWDDTKKLINIYGIAAGMAYLQKREIAHRDLKPANILLDDLLYPKIADFGLSKYINDEDNNYNYNLHRKKNKNILISGFKGTYAYSAPEIIIDHKYSDKGDVYSFAMITYEIITNEFPFAGFNQYQLYSAILKGYRPQFKDPIPYCYKNLILKCWNEDFNLRPNFTKICQTLENDPNFITQNVNKEEYLDYIDYVKESQKNIINEKSFQQNEHQIKINKISINSQRIEEIENESYDFFIDLNKFEKQKIINKEDTIKIYQICDKETQELYTAHMTMIKTDQIPKEEIEKLSKEIKNISLLKHHSLLKFIGFSLNEKKPVIVTELVSNGSLSQILELERMNKKINGWDYTKKLINIYGIALGMAYMHSHGIIHRCLKPSNIFLDDILFPKIGDFGLLTKFYNFDNMSHQSISGEIGTPIYTAPEVLESNNYSKSSDVYAFAFIVYEISSNEKPFAEINKKSQIFNKIVLKGERPEIKNEIPIRFKKLIENCWLQNPFERPEFDDIVHILRTDSEFITEKINKDDYLKYIDFIDSQKDIQSNQKIEENCSDNESQEKIIEVCEKVEKSDE